MIEVVPEEMVASSDLCKHYDAMCKNCFHFFLVTLKALPMSIYIYVWVSYY